MVSFTRIVFAAAAFVASSAFVSAVPTLPVKDMSAVPDPAQRAAIDKNIGCITGTCGRNTTLASTKANGAISIPGWSTSAVAAVAAGGILVTFL